MNHTGSKIEARLWAAVDELEANSKLKSGKYSVTVLGLVYLRYSDHKIQATAKELLATLKNRKLVQDWESGSRRGRT
jgi:type I restriction enzyme M protein